MQVGGSESFVSCDPDNPPEQCQPGKLGGAYNYGSLITSGQQVDGMGGFDYGVTLVNTGTINASGPKSNGIVLHGEGRSTIENSGLVKVSDHDGAVAIRMRPTTGGDMREGTTYHLNLNSGSVLVGRVALSRPDVTTVNFGLGLNAAVEIESEDLKIA